MGKAKYPYNKNRPTPLSVLQAIEDKDVAKLLKSLSHRQRRFCEEFVVDYNATAACIRAGYSPKWADRQAGQLKKNLGVIALIDYLSMSKEAKITAIDPDYVIQRVVSIINAEGAKDGDKLRGLELLARHLGMFIERTEISGPDGGAIEMREIKEATDEFSEMIRALRRNQEAQEKTDIELV